MFDSALLDYEKYKNEKRVLHKIYPDWPENIFLLVGGRKKRVVLQALEGYLEMFGIDPGYRLLDISRYENWGFKLAVFTDKAGFKRLAFALYKYSCRKLYGKIKG